LATKVNVGYIFESTEVVKSSVPDAPMLYVNVLAVTAVIAN
jgi:hypothetical protein